MRNVTNVGLCWAMTLGLVAVALGQQQPATTWGNAPQSAPQTIDTTGLPVEQALRGQGATGLPAVFVPASGAIDAQQNAANQKRNFGEQPAMPAPDAPQDRSLITGTNQLAQPAMNGGQRRGELGIWMGETGGPGVRILRVNGGSAAEQAGLRVGDVILQVNGRGAASPQGAAQLVRQIAIGETGTLMIWRDGNQQQMQVTMQPVREIAREMTNERSHQVGFEGADSANDDLASRTMRLEHQISSLTQELAAMRQELAQLRATGPVQTGFNAEANQSAPPQGSRYNAQPSATSPAPTTPVAPPPGFGQSDEKPAKGAAEPAKSATPPAATESAKPVAPPAPSTEKSAASNPFGSDSAQPKTGEKPKAEEKPKADDKGGTDDLFK